MTPDLLFETSQLCPFCKPENLIIVWGFFLNFLSNSSRLSTLDMLCKVFEIVIKSSLFQTIPYLTQQPSVQTFSSELHYVVFAKFRLSHEQMAFLTLLALMATAHTAHLAEP